jgi:hypothetical protein
MDYQSIAKVLKKERCEKHKIKATVVPINDTIKLSCCCDYFKEKLLKQIERESKKQDKGTLKKLYSEIAFQKTIVEVFD